MATTAGTLTDGAAAPVYGGAAAADRDQLSFVQRSRFLSAAIGATAQKGLARTTIGDVVAHSGASRRTFYEQFGALDECLTAAFEDALGRLAEDVLAAYRAEARWSERVRDALIALLRFLELEPAAARFLFVESLGAGATVLDMRRRALAAIAAELDVAGTAARGKRGDLPPLVGEGVVGGVLGVLHTRLLSPEPGSLPLLTGPLTAMVLLPYLGSAAARRELERPAPAAPMPSVTAYGDKLSGLGMRLTYRTVRVLSAIATQPGASNRALAGAAGIGDQGQMSKLLARFERLGIISNHPVDNGRARANAWRLTDRGEEIYAAIEGRSDAA